MSDNHEPWCGSQLGPDFEVVPGEVRMTLHVCLGCKGAATANRIPAPAEPVTEPQGERGGDA